MQFDVRIQGNDSIFAHCELYYSTINPYGRRIVFNFNSTDGITLDSAIVITENTLHSDAFSCIIKQSALLNPFGTELVNRCIEFVLEKWGVDVSGYDTVGESNPTGGHFVSGSHDIEFRVYNVGNGLRQIIYGLQANGLLGSLKTLPIAYVYTESAMGQWTQTENDNLLDLFDSSAKTAIQQHFANTFA